MALIDINPDFKRVVAQLKRIADALETLLRLQFAYVTTPPKRTEPMEEEDVSYASNEDTLKRELEEARREIEQNDEAGLVK